MSYTVSNTRVGSDTSAGGVVGVWLGLVSDCYHYHQCRRRCFASAVDGHVTADVCVLPSRRQLVGSFYAGLTTFKDNVIRGLDFRGFASTFALQNG